MKEGLTHADTEPSVSSGLGGAAPQAIVNLFETERDERRVYELLKNKEYIDRLSFAALLTLVSKIESLARKLIDFDQELDHVDIRILASNYPDLVDYILNTPTLSKKFERIGKDKTKKSYFVNLGLDRSDIAQRILNNSMLTPKMNTEDWARLACKHPCIMRDLLNKPHLLNDMGRCGSLNAGIEPLIASDPAIFDQILNEPAVKKDKVLHDSIMKWLGVLAGRYSESIALQVYECIKTENKVTVNSSNNCSDVQEVDLHPAIIQLACYHSSIAHGVVDEYLSGKKKISCYFEEAIGKIACNHPTVAQKIIDNLSVFHEECIDFGELGQKNICIAQKILEIVGEQLSAFDLKELGGVHCSIAKDILNNPTFLGKLDGRSLSLMVCNHPEIVQQVINDRDLRHKLDGSSLSLMVCKYPDIVQQVINDRDLRDKLDGRSLSLMVCKYPDIVQQVINDRDLRDKLDGRSLSLMVCKYPDIVQQVINDRDLRDRLDGEHLALMVCEYPEIVDQVINDRAFLHKWNAASLGLLSEQYLFVAEKILNTPSLHKLPVELMKHKITIASWVNAIANKTCAHINEAKEASATQRTIVHP